MFLPISYAQHALSSLQRERAESVLQLPRAPLPHESFRRFRDYEVHIDRHGPEVSHSGTVLLIHGAGANGRLLAPFAVPFVSRGLRVLAPDLPGYGITRGDTSHTCYEAWIELVTELADEAAQDGPVVLYGLSVGGLTALRAAQKARRVSAVIATTLIELADPSLFDAAARSRALGKIARWSFRHAPGLCDRIALPLHWLAPLELLTTDRALVRLLARDPLLGARRVSLRFMRSLHEYVPERADYDLPCPLLLVHPGADRWTSPALSMKVFNAVRSQKQLALLSTGSHAPLEPAAYAELTETIQRFLDEQGISAR
jgi:alpha-beta hydrolase superfamily lysophospholipase